MPDELRIIMFEINGKAETKPKPSTQGTAVDKSKNEITKDEPERDITEEIKALNKQAEGVAEKIEREVKDYKARSKKP